jgi:hypothetical protein
MKKLWLLWLMVPGLLAGCMDIPNIGRPNQTVHDGAPPPVDPKMAQSSTAENSGKQLHTISSMKDMGQSGSTSSVPAAKAKVGLPTNLAPDMAQRVPPPAEQITPANADQALRGLQDQIERDLGAPPVTGKGPVNGAWPK